MAAKTSCWAGMKLAYNKSNHDTLPFLAPLSRTTKAEIASVEETLAMWSNGLEAGAMIVGDVWVQDLATHLNNL